MVIISAKHYEIDALQKQEYFINQEVADRHVKNWKVTDWGHVHFSEVQVTEE